MNIVTKYLEESFLQPSLFDSPVQEIVFIDGNGKEIVLD